MATKDFHVSASWQGGSELDARNWSKIGLSKLRGENYALRERVANLEKMITTKA